MLGECRLWVGVCDGLRKVIAGHGLTVKALEVERHALGKALAAHQGLHHPNNLSTFFVNGDGVKVVYFFVLIRPDRVRHRTRILWELRGS